MFQDLEHYGFVKQFEDNWELIRREATGLPRSQYRPWPEYNLHGKGWFVFGLVHLGKDLLQNQRKCPSTTTFLKRVPDLYTAGFSLLEPHTIISPHRGQTKRLIRCHLGLVIPENCGIKVAGEIRNWQAGKMLIFDDTSEHEAWNNSDQNRIVLLFDTRRPKVKWDQEWKVPNVNA